MPTGNTPLLGLALPATGELTGTWGDVVNNQITSLLDSAVAGTTTLSTDADVTLTTTDFAANEARQAILLATGARSTVRNIVAPARSKTYIVINQTTGGFGVVIKSAATPGVTVPNGNSAVVAWNGSDFAIVASGVAGTGAGTVTSVAVSGGSTGLTTSGGPITTSGTISLGGTLAITNGGTGATSIATARSNLNAQESLVSGSNIKTINGVSLLGSGNVSVGSGVSTGAPNTWTAPQTFENNDFRLLGLSTGYTTLNTANVGTTNYTVSFPAASGDVVLATGSQQLFSKILTGTTEVRVSMAGSNIDATTGNYFTRTVAGTTTFTITNVPSAGVGTTLAYSFILDLTNGGSAAITWFANTKWAGGIPPILTVAGRDVLGFYTYDGGSTWTGLVLAKDVK